MTSLRQQLRSGECGVTWEAPGGVDVLNDDEHQLVLRDPEAGVVWQVRASAMPFAVDPAHREVLRLDLEASARAAFDAAWEPPDDDSVPQRRRTDDPAWSPVIDHAVVELDGRPALRLLRRHTYQPGNELVVGHLIVPTATGHVDFSVIARAAVTGMRESVVMLMSDRMPDTLDGEGEYTFPAQAVYDDVALDEKFPDHPLTRVRAAIGRLEVAVTITGPVPRCPEVTTLEEARCAFTAPPRYLPVPPEVMGISPTLRVLVRSGVELWRYMIEVWRMEDVRFRRRDPRRELCELARRTVAGWAHEGATDIDSVEVIDEFAQRPQIQQTVRMIAGGTRRRLVLRWWVEPDGVVYRVGSGGPGTSTDAEHLALLDAIQATWRRLDRPGPARAPWWRVW
jgi:hypothetical protein